MSFKMRILNSLNALESNSSSYQDDLFNIAKKIILKNNSNFSFEEKKEFMEIIFNKGLDVNHRDSNGNNLFGSILYNSQHQLIVYLYDKGMDCLVKNKDNRLMVSFFPTKSLKYVLSKGCNIPEDIFDDADEHPYFNSKGKFYLKVKSYIKNPNMVNRNGENIAFILKFNHKKLLELKELGVNFSLINKDNETILFSSSINKLKVLRKQKIHINMQQKNKNGFNVFESQLNKINGLLTYKKFPDSSQELELELRKMEELIQYAEVINEKCPLLEIFTKYSPENIPKVMIPYKLKIEQQLMKKMLVEADLIKKDIKIPASENNSRRL